MTKYLRNAPFCIFPHRGQTTQLFRHGVVGGVLAPIGGKVSVRTERGLFYRTNIDSFNTVTDFKGYKVFLSE